VKGPAPRGPGAGGDCPPSTSCVPAQAIGGPAAATQADESLLGYCLVFDPSRRTEAANLALSCAKSATIVRESPAGLYASNVDEPYAEEWRDRTERNETVNRFTCRGGAEDFDTLARSTNQAMAGLAWQQKLCAIGCVVTRTVRYHLPGISFDEALHGSLSFAQFRDNQTAISTVATKQGSCLGYSALFQELAERAGFRARIVAGATPWANANGKHAWVEIDAPDGSGKVLLEPQDRTCTLRR
jgi:hypothetical protein